MRRAVCLSIAMLLLSRAEAAPPAGPDWRPAPEFVALFTPARPAGAYEAYVTGASLDAVLRRLGEEPATLRPPGAWTPVPTVARDAFGGHGTHNPWDLARLYGGTVARVARGPRGAAGRTAESWTLISPYPDATLSHLDPGTLLLIVRIP